MSQPIDAAVRARAVSDTHVSFALSAGAGSGKTSVLSERVVQLLAEGKPPREVAAITFTEKAAGELQRRVRDSLESRANSAEGELADTLRRALASFHDLTLSTIHAFCRELLMAEPLASRWAPGTEIMQHATSALPAALRESRALMRERDPRLALLFDDLASEYSLQSVVGVMLERRDLRPFTSDEKLDWAEVHAGLVEYQGRLEQLCEVDPSSKIVENNEQFRRRLSRWIADGVDGAAQALVTDGKAAGIGRRGGRKGEWLDAFKEHLNGFDEWRGRCLARAHASLVQTLYDLVLPQVLEGRQRQGRATYDDLLHRAAALLRDDEVRGRLASRWSALLIDEVQDTDPIQAEIAVLLARAPADVGAWATTMPRAGHLFAVGDAKQSIYRFRRADITVWEDLRETVAKADVSGVASLQQNFRSVPALVAWANHTYADMPAYEAQVAWRGEASIDPLVLLECEEGGQTQVDAVLAHLLDMKNSGAEVVDRTSGEARPMRWDDVMVLLPRWALADETAECFLHAGIEAIVEGGNGFFPSDEIRLSVSALRALDEPSDSEAVVHVLRGLFGLTAEELARHRSEGGSWRYTVQDQPLTEAARALAVLRDVRQAPYPSGSWVLRLDSLLERTGALAVWSLMNDGLARLANVDKLRALIRELELEERSAAKVVKELTEASKKGDEAELSRLDADTEAVRVTTVFKAKGLEAPIVVLLDMERTKSSVSSVADRQAGVLHVAAKPFYPPGWDDTKAAEEEALEEERARWMYVAGTRARDQLVIARHPKANLLAHLSAGLPDEETTHATDHDEHVTIVPDFSVRVRHADALPEVPYRVETFPGHDAALDMLLEAPAGKGDPDGTQRAEELATAVRASKRKCARWRSVGEVVRGQRHRSDEAHVASGVGRLGGLVVHRALECIDLKADVGELHKRVPDVVGPLAAESQLSAEITAACVSVVMRILEHTVFEQARKAPFHWKETPFAFEERGRVITGIIDFCFPTDETLERWVVVDWKSDAPAPGSQTRADYEKQVAVYAKALLATVTPCQEVQPLVVGPHVELPVSDESEGALELVVDALRAPLRRLLDEGCAVPTVGYEVPGTDGLALELAWPESKHAVAIDLSAAELKELRDEGWTLVASREQDPDWSARVEQGMREMLDVEQASLESK